MLRNGVLTCPRCRISSMTVGLETGFRCDGCGRTSGGLDWDARQVADELESPFISRPDLKELYRKKS